MRVKIYLQVCPATSRITAFEPFRKTGFLEITHEVDEEALPKDFFQKSNWLFQDGQIIEDTSSCEMQLMQDKINGLEKEDESDILRSSVSFKDYKNRIGNRQFETAKLKEQLNDLIISSFNQRREIELNEMIKADIEKDKSAKYKFAICLLTKDRNHFIEEFARHHFDLGFEHIFIYDNGSKMPVQEMVNNFSEELKSKITVIPSPTESEQHQIAVYNDFIKDYGKDCIWTAFIDDDEHLCFDGLQVDEYVAKFNDKKDCGAINLIYENYGANGHFFKTDDDLKIRFTKPRTSIVYPPNLGKLIVRVSRATKMWIHESHLRPWNRIYTDCGCSMTHSDIFSATATPKTCKGSTRHYFTLSMEEWLEKYYRGDISGNFKRNIKEYLLLNPEHKKVFNKVLEKLNFKKDDRYYNYGGKDKPQIDIKKTIKQALKS